jgi:hypothetical protein
MESPAGEGSAAVAEDAPSLPAASERAAESSVGPTLLVDDEGDSSRGQMRKTEFLTALRVEVCATVDAALSADVPPGPEANLSSFTFPI